MKTTVALGEGISSCHRLQMTALMMSSGSFLLTGICKKHSSQPLESGDSTSRHQLSFICDDLKETVKLVVFWVMSSL